VLDERIGEMRVFRERLAATARGVHAVAEGTSPSAVAWTTFLVKAPTGSRR
jgi:hypothetical protein